MNEEKLAGLRRFLLAAILVVGANPAQALMVDDFSADQTLTVLVPGTNAADQTGGGGMLGGERDMALTRISGVGVTMVASGGSLSYGHIAGSVGTGRIVWDGADGSASLDPTGLGGLDLSDGGVSDAFALSILLNDFSASLTLVAYTDGANYSTATVLMSGNIPPDPQETLTILFTDFLPTGGGADFSNIGALELFIDGSTVSALDVEFGEIQTVQSLVVPEPSTGTLLLGGLLLMACRGLLHPSRRQRARDSMAL